MKKTLLITGGSGFLGSCLAKKLMSKYKIILGSRNNSQNRLAAEKIGCSFTPLDVVNIESIRDAFNKYQPDIVIHAAATKYVDLAEEFPFECIDVNIIGSMNLARVAIESKTKIVIGISTDKTAPPINNIYGLSKSIMEKLYCTLNNQNKTFFSCVRFGNIAWSTGSVFPIWKKMSENNKIIHSTGPNMRRFFFTVDEAADLVINCLKNINLTKGKVLCVNMKSTQIKTILNLWKQKYKISWKKMNERKGDKQDEFLIGNSELPFTKKIFINGKKHFLISFNEKVKNKLKKSLSTKNSEKLKNKEIINLIDSARYD